MCLISLIIPAYNEARSIEKSLGIAYKFFNDNNLVYEIIVVDDGSTDATVSLVQRFGSGVKLFRQPKNMGKGAAVRRGMLEAKGEIRIFSDADFSTPVNEVLRAVEAIQSGIDIFIGSRALDPDRIKEHQPFYREWMGKTFNKIVQLLVVKGIKDTQCGFKGFKAKAAEKIFSVAKIDGFSFDVEIVYLANKYGFTMLECPVDWYNDKRSTVSPVKDSIKMFLEILKIRNLHK